jgi:hypothetical protein
MRDPAFPTVTATLNLPGDLDTITPWGNVALLSVDEEAVEAQGTSVVPWRTDPDPTAPTLLHHRPADGEVDVPITIRVGLGWDELIEPASAYEGSIRLYEDDTDTPVRGWVSTQENTVSYAPREPLTPGTRYRVSIEARGVADVHGNEIVQGTTFTFTTAP